MGTVRSENCRQKMARLLLYSYMFCCRVKWEMRNEKWFWIWNRVHADKCRCIIQIHGTCSTNVVEKEREKRSEIRKKGKIMALLDIPTEFYTYKIILYYKKLRRNKIDYDKRGIMREASNIVLWNIFKAKHAMEIEF